MTQPRPERIFHIATLADWTEARRTGTYSTSTLGRTLAEEGFIHASRRDQVSGVFGRYYRTASEPLVLLTIAPERLEAEVRDETVGTESYPHVHGPINRSAVINVTPLSKRGQTESMATLFVKDMARRMLLAIAVMGAAVIGSVIGGAVSDSAAAPLFGAIAGLVVGAVAGWLFVRTRH